MLAKIIAFTGSPRENGHTNELLAEFIRGVKAKNGDVKVYDLNGSNLRGCQGCLYCRDHHGWSQKDLLTPVYEELQHAVGVVLTSPIYFGHITGQAKMWLDRMFPMLDGQNFKPRYPGKKVVTIFSQGDANPQRFTPAINFVHGFLHSFGWKLQSSLLCAGASSPNFRMPKALLRKASMAGVDMISL